MTGEGARNCLRGHVRDGGGRDPLSCVQEALVVHLLGTKSLMSDECKLGGRRTEIFPSGYTYGRPVRPPANLNGVYGTPLGGGSDIGDVLGSKRVQVTERLGEALELLERAPVVEKLVQRRPVPRGVISCVCVWWWCVWGGVLEG